MNSITNLRQNQNKVIVSMGYDSITTSVTLASGHGAILPDPSIIPYNLTWWNSTDYLSPTDDPSVEIVKCIAKFGDTLVIMRSQQQTLASPKNIHGKLYNMAYLPDSNLDTNLDTLSYYNEPQIHGKTKHDATTIDGGIALPIGQLPVHGISAHTGTIGAWANIDKTTSNIADITTKSHTSLTDIGTNTHADIDATISNISKGVSWTARSATEANAWYSVTYGNGLFVAVAGNGTNRVMTSPDGITWTARSATEANTWRSVTYGNGLFVAVAQNGTNRVMTSPDGITWTARSATEANNWYSVTYGNGLFVAVAGFGTNQVMTSPDGITWTARSATEANNWLSVTYGNGLFVAIAASGTNRVMTSPDSITWTARSATEANYWQSVTYGNGLFVVVTNSGTNRVMTSPDGITWTARSAAEANSWQSVTYGNGLFVAIAGSGTNRVMTSPDGITWTARSAAEANNWLSVTYGNGLFVAVAGANRVMTSGKSELNIIPTNNIYQGGMSINGNVGIGTTNPTAKLHIGGTPGTDGIKFPDGTIQTTAATSGPTLVGVTPTLSGSWATAPAPLSEIVNGDEVAFTTAGAINWGAGRCYITLDSGSTKPGILLYYFSTGRSGSTGANHILEASPNGSTWTEILAANTAGTTQRGIFGMQGIRYVRFSIDTTNTGTAYLYNLSLTLK